MKPLEDYTIGQLLAALSKDEDGFIETCWPELAAMVAGWKAIIKQAMRYEAGNLTRMED